MEINDFTRDLTKEAESGLLESPIGREDELKTIIKMLSQEGKSSVLLLGPAGSGKTIIAEGLALLIVNNETPKDFPRKRILELNMTALNSGAMYVGQFEERVTTFINEIKNDPTTIIFIDEIHMLMGFGKTGDSGASRDFSQIIKPLLARGQIVCLGATTKEEFDQYMASDNAFVRRFQILSLPPLRHNAIKEILKRYTIKQKYLTGLEIDPDTIDACIQASDTLYPNRFQPDKSIDILKRLLMAETSGGQSDHLKEDHSLKSYIALLNKQKKALSSNRYQEAATLAIDWLGIRKLRAKQIHMDSAKIIATIKI